MGFSVSQSSESQRQEPWPRLFNAKFSGNARSSGHIYLSPSEYIFRLVIPKDLNYSTVDVRTLRLPPLYLIAVLPVTALPLFFHC